MVGDQRVDPDGSVWQEKQRKECMPGYPGSTKWEQIAPPGSATPPSTAVAAQSANGNGSGAAQQQQLVAPTIPKWVLFAGLAALFLFRRK